MCVCMQDVAFIKFLDVIFLRTVQSISDGTVDFSQLDNTTNPDKQNGKSNFLRVTSDAICGKVRFMHAAIARAIHCMLANPLNCRREVLFFHSLHFIPSDAFVASEYKLK